MLYFYSILWPQIVLTKPVPFGTKKCSLSHWLDSAQKGERNKKDKRRKYLLALQYTCLRSFLKEERKPANKKRTQGYKVIPWRPADALWQEMRGEGMGNEPEAHAANGLEKTKSEQTL